MASIKAIMQKIFIILTLISLNSCYESMPKSWNWGGKPRPLTGVRNFPPANTDYGRGFKDGCEALWVVTAKGAVDFKNPKLNPVLMSKSPDYASGFYDGSEQCTYVVDWDVL